jgi:hypothetical protein
MKLTISYNLEPVNIYEMMPIEKGLFHRNKYSDYQQYMIVRNEVCRLLFDMGIKIKSLANMRKADVDLDKMIVSWKMTGNSQKVQQLNICDNDIQVKLKYLMDTSLHLNSPYLFQSREVNDNNHGIHRSIIARILDKFGSRRKFDKKRIDYDSFKNTNEYGVHFAKLAKKRKIEFNLSDLEVESVVFKNCFYCDRKPNQYQYVFGKKINGIDRIDSQLGYIIGNVVACCGMCNGMKMGRDVDVFLDKIESIYNHRIKETNE